jgi:hypothetical protein
MTALALGIEESSLENSQPSLQGADQTGVAHGWASVPPLLHGGSYDVLA